jgi:PAS domain S-box-containing protein
MVRIRVAGTGMTAPKRLPHSAMEAPQSAGAAAGITLTDAELARWRAELLDPDKWAEILARFALTMKLAVALTDVDGNVLGDCHNPQPLWILVRSSAAGGFGCPFCLASEGPCNAVAAALAENKITFTRDRAGLTHMTIPLTLGNRHLGSLIAGQVFAEYPQPLALQRVARDFRVSSQVLWNLAVHAVPLSHATLRLYADLLQSLGEAFLGQRYAAILNKERVEQDQRYRLMIEASTDRALLTVDRAGRVTNWNAGAERLLGYKESEVRGRDYALFFTPEDARSGIPKRELQRTEQDGWLKHEGWQVRKDGTRFFSETVMSRLDIGAGEYGRLLHDVTAQRNAAQAAMQAQKLESIGVLAGGIAHDFNNLLTSILGNVSLAMSSLPDDDPALPNLQTAERSSLKAAALVAQLLAYAGKSNVVVSRFDLSVLIAEILPLIETSIPKTVHLDLHLQPGLPWIEADSIEIEQIIMNLVINGAEAIGPLGGSVRVTTGAVARESRETNQPDIVYLEVQDSGCGMDEATQSRIFDPFFTTKFTGRGLGLAAVSGIVRRLSGRVEVQTAPGVGSTFRIALPSVPRQSPELKVLVKTDLHGTGLILVVDDDSNVLNLARAILERYGYTVLIAENGKAALQVFRDNAEKITAVLMDLTMPVMGGGEAFQLMTQIRPEIPIIISSGYGEAQVREQFTEALAGVIQKPYTVAELGRKIEAILARKKTADSRKPGTTALGAA